MRLVDHEGNTPFKLAVLTKNYPVILYLLDNHRHVLPCHELIAAKQALEEQLQAGIAGERDELVSLLRKFDPVPVRPEPAHSSPSFFTRVKNCFTSTRQTPPLVRYLPIRYDEHGTPIVKVVMHGVDVWAGNNTLIKRIETNTFCESLHQLIGVDFVTKIIDGIKYQIWAMAAQERFRTIKNTYYSGAAIAIIIFDGSLHHIHHIRQENADVNSYTNGGEIRKILVCTKVDLRAAGEPFIATEQGRAIAEEIGAVYVECSAKTGQGMDDLYDRLSAIGEELVAQGACDDHMVSGRPGMGV